MRPALHTWQPHHDLDQFPLHICTVTAPQAAATLVLPCLGHLRFLFSFNIGKSFKWPQFCNPLHQQMLGCMWGVGGWRKQSGVWDPGQSSYPRSTLAVKAGEGKKEVIPSERSRERLPTAMQTASLRLRAAACPSFIIGVPIISLLYVYRMNSNRTHFSTLPPPPPTTNHPLPPPQALSHFYVILFFFVTPWVYMDSLIRDRI